jgi:DNA-binding transcriptional regulator YiaG
MGKRYYSEASMVCHESVKDLYEIGAISEAEMKEFDERCFVQEPEESYAAEPSAELEHKQSPLALSLGG